MNGCKTTKHNSSARYLWCLKCSNVDEHTQINHYYLIIDVVDVHEGKVYRHFVILHPTKRRKDSGEWYEPQIDFGAFSNQAPYLLNIFGHLRTDYKNNPDECFPTLAAIDERLKRLSLDEHYFTYECFNAILNMFYDFFEIKKMMYAHCTCKQLIDNRCKCSLMSIVTSWRSFTHDIISNDSIPLEYVFNDNSIIDTLQCYEVHS